MAKRILMVVLPADRDAEGLLARAAAQLARDSGGSVRMAFIAPIPGARRDRNDYVVATSEQEIERITADAAARLARLSWELELVPAEQVVRFGRLRREVAIEAELFGADLVALAAAPRLGLRRQLIAWHLGRALSPRVPVALLPRAPEGGLDRRLALAQAR